MRIFLVGLLLVALGWLAWILFGGLGERAAQSTDVPGLEQVQQIDSALPARALQDAADATVLQQESSSEGTSKRAALAPQAAEASDVPAKGSATLIVHVTPQHLEVRVALAVKGTNHNQMRSAVMGSQSHLWLWHGDRGADRTVRLEGLPCGVELVEHVFLSDGYRRVQVNATPWVFEDGEVRERFITLKEPVTLTGVVRWDDENPAADEKVWVFLGGKGVGSLLSPSGNAPFRSTTTDVNGEYRIEHLAEGAWWVGVPPDRSLGPKVEPRHPSKTIRLDIPPFEKFVQLDLTLHTGTYISGHIEGADGSRRRGNVRLNHAPEAVKRGEGHYFLSTKSDEEGNFRLGPLNPSLYTLEASGHLKGIPAASVIVTAPADDVVLRIIDGFTVTGRAIDPSSGQPLAATFQLLEGELSVPHMQFGLSKPEEGETFGGLKPGPCTVSAITHDGRFGFMSTTLDVLGQRTWRTDLPMHPGGKLAITYEGQNPRAQLDFVKDGTTVWSASVNRNQRYLLTVPAGPLTVRFFSYRAGVRTVPKEEFVIIQPGETTTITVRDEG